MIERTTRTSAELRGLLAEPGLLRIAGAYDGLTAMLADEAGFDGVWASGLAISVAHGVPDASILTMTELLGVSRVIKEASKRPVIADCDTGFGDAVNVARMVQQYERAGIDAVCIEDKIFPKRNSLVGVDHQLEEPQEFAVKIKAAKAAQSGDRFMVFARVESLIAGLPISEALGRAALYCEAGADGILIHSKAPTASEVLEFAERWDASDYSRIPLAIAPTTYFHLSCSELEGSPVRLVIYANQCIRAAMQAVARAYARTIADGTTATIEDEIAPISELFRLVGMDLLSAREARVRAGLGAMHIREPV